MGDQERINQDRLLVHAAAERVLRPSAEVSDQAKARLDSLTKPQGSLGRLEEVLIEAAGMQRMAIPRFDQAHVVIMAGDHRITEEGVSAYPSAVTAQMVMNFLGGGAAVCALARQAGAQVHVVDIGVQSEVSHPLLLAKNVRRGARNWAREEALTAAEVWRALSIGVQMGETLAQGGGHVVVLGEMGIGNTTVSAAILATLTGLPVASLTGYGTGIDEAGRAHKVAIIEAALRLHRPNPQDPIDVLKKIGGLEIAGLAGLAIGAAAQQAVVLVDGLISTVAVLLSMLLEPRVGAYVLAGHQSAEPGHAVALQRLGRSPLLQLGMRLGEASGAVLALSLLQGAERAMREMATFEQASVSTQSERTVQSAPPTPVRHVFPHSSAAEREKQAPRSVATEHSEVGSIPPVLTSLPMQTLVSAQVAATVPASADDRYFTQMEREAVYKAIYLRRDIRTFRPDPIPEEALLRILKAGHHAPSVGYMQPWNFILIRSEETKLALRDVVDRERQAAALHFQEQRGDLYLRLKVEGLREAPLTVCVTSDPTRGGDHVLGRNSIPETDLFSVSCAIENMWLAARSENIALGWVSIFKKADIRTILAIPHHVEPVGLLSLGYTKEWPERPLLELAGWRGRVPFEDVLYSERWGMTTAPIVKNAVLYD